MGFFADKKRHENTDEEELFLQTLDEIDRQYPSRHDDDQIQKRIMKKADVVKNYDNLHETAYFNDMNGFNADLMRLPVRHKFDIALAYEQTTYGSVIDNIHDRFDIMPDTPAWEKGYNSIAAMDEAEYKAMSFWEKIKAFFGRDRDDAAVVMDESVSEGAVAEDAPKAAETETENA